MMTDGMKDGESLGFEEDGMMCLKAGSVREASYYKYCIRSELDNDARQFKLVLPTASSLTTVQPIRTKYNN